MSITFRPTPAYNLLWASVAGGSVLTTGTHE